MITVQMMKSKTVWISSSAQCSWFIETESFVCLKYINLCINEFTVKHHLSSIDVSRNNYTPLPSASAYEK